MWQKMLDSLSQTKTKGIRESFDKKLIQAAIGAKYKLGFGEKTWIGVVGYGIGKWTTQACEKKSFHDAELSVYPLTICGQRTW